MAISRFLDRNVFGPSGFWTIAPLHYALLPGTIQGKEGIKFCHLATLNLGGGGGGNGSISFYSSANGHCGSVSSLRSGVSDNSQGRKIVLDIIVNVFSCLVICIILHIIKNVFIDYRLVG